MRYLCQYIATTDANNFHLKQGTEIITIGLSKCMSLLSQVHTCWYQLGIDI